MSRKQEIEKELRKEFRKKSHIKAVIEIVVVLIVIASIAYMYLFSSQEIEPTPTLSFVSSTDSDIQAEIQSITSYNWSSFSNTDISDDTKLTAMLLLASEVSVIDKQFEFLNETVGISTEEWSELGLIRINVSYVTKSDLLDLISNLKNLQQFYFSKGFSTSDIRVNRLDYLYTYFEANDLPYGEMPLDAQFLVGDLLGVSTETYEQTIALMIVKYDIIL